MLGGYSLGAAVTDVVLAAAVRRFFGFNNPLPLGMDQHIAAVALFGNGSRMGSGRSRTSTRSTPSGPSSCATAPIRSATPPTRDTWEENWTDHLAKAYIDAGMVNQAADFVAARL